MSTPDEGSMANLIEQAARRMWSAWEERVTRVPWHHAGPWRQRKFEQMAQALHTAGLLVDPAAGRDLNRLQASRDEWRGRANAAEAAGALDRKRATDAARVSAAANDAAGRLQRQVDELTERLGDMTGERDRAMTDLADIATLVVDEAQAGRLVARAVLDVVRRSVDP